MFRILESQAPARQTATDTINTLSSRLQSSTLLEDRRAAILGLRSFAKEYPASVASGALRPLIASLRNDGEDVDTVKVVLETLLMLFSPDENSPEASDELALWLADEFTQRQDNTTAVLDLLDSKDFYSRLYSLQLISHISAARLERTQESILAAPLGISRIVNILGDAREPVRNEALLILITLTISSTELQKVVAFENAFDHIFALIEAEGSLTHGSSIVEDCLSLLANLLQLNPSNQSFFRETGGITKLARLLDDTANEQETDGGLPEWTLAQRDKNLWGVLAIVQLFLVKGGISTPVNQTALWQSGVIGQLLWASFSEDFSIAIKSKALITCADLIRANSALQEKFSDIDVVLTIKQEGEHSVNGNPTGGSVEKLNVLEALLRLTLQQSAVNQLDARLAACECIQAFFANHSGIKPHFLRRAISGHSGGDDQIPNFLTILLRPPEHRGISDPYQSWLASVILFHLVYEDPDTKTIAMGVTEGDESSGEEVITCIQSITGNLITGLQRNDDERVSVGYLMLLCGWLYEDPDAVNDFLGEGSSIQSLIQETKQGSSSGNLLPGLCAVLLGITYEFSSKDSPISRETLHQLLMNRLGREVYIDKITKLREHPLVRDFEVLPQTAQQKYDTGLPGVYFDKTFIDFLKDNFSRLTRAIDRDPGFEVPVMANGIHKGISRELVDSLQSQLEDKVQSLQKLESDMLNLQRKLEQEQLDHKKTRTSTELELTRFKSINESLQKSHEEEVSKIQKENEVTRNGLVKQHNDQIRDLDNQLKQTSMDYESRATKVRERNEAEVAELKQTVQTLESRTAKAEKNHVQDLQTAHEEYSSKLSTLEAQCRRAEERAEEAREDARKSEAELTGLRKDIAKSKTEAEERETARKAAQNELEDLLIVFSDLEVKRKEDKKRLKALGEGVSEGETESDDGGDESDDDD